MKLIKSLFDKIKRSKFLESKYFPYVVIFIFSVLLIWPTFDGKFHIGDDQIFHMANIEAFSKDLPLSIFSKILPDLC